MLVVPTNISWLGLSDRLSGFLINLSTLSDLLSLGIIASDKSVQRSRSSNRGIKCKTLSCVLGMILSLLLL
jgi:hypothetical protein